jgi:hypothetical protein
MNQYSIVKENPMRDNKLTDLLIFFKKHELDKPATDGKARRKEKVFSEIKEIGLEEVITKEKLIDYLNALNHYGNWVSCTIKEEHCRLINKFVLLEIPLWRLPNNEEIHFPENIEPFKKLYNKSGWLPPIIYDHYKNYIIDGRHRVEVARQLGHKSILGFVGVPYLSHFLKIQKERQNA